MTIGEICSCELYLRKINITFCVVVVFHYKLNTGRLFAKWNATVVGNCFFDEVRAQKVSRSTLGVKY
jgi:hypothetical protein